MWYQKLKLLLALLVLLCFSSLAYSQDVGEMTEQELLNELTTILTSLETDNSNLTIKLATAENKLMILQATLTEQQQLSITQQQALKELRTSLQNFKDEELKKQILTGIVSGLAVGFAGFIFGLLIN